MDPVFQAHPIPQNVTNFEFHLVGDMTIKQFGYLAVGLAIAFVTFIGLAQPFPFIAWPIILISAATGAAFAFIPIQERPLDHWMAAFFKAIFHPTKLVYDSKILKKEDPYFNKRVSFYIKNKHAGEHLVASLGVPPPITSTNPTLTSMAVSSQRRPSMADRLLAGQQTAAPAAPLSSPSQTGSSPKPQLLGSVPSFAAPATPPRPREAPKPADLKKTVDLAKDAQETQSKILKIEKQLEQIKATVAQPGADAKFYVDQFQSLLTDLQKLNEHASGTAHDLAILANTPPAPTPVATAAPVKSAAPLPLPKVATTVKLTSFPNVINGIVTDSQGNYVQGAIVVAHDKQGLPVRALRSNKLGQFVAATPLPEGPYTIVVEKDNMVFDQVAIELQNEVPQPILVSAKKQVPVATA